MGRFSAQLAPGLADYVGVRAGQRVLDVGCGPGQLTTELVERVGADAVAAVDPSEPFVAAARSRHPNVDVRVARAEELPYADDTFDVAVAQLVVHFMADPVAGLREMARVTRPDGAVAASVWDFAGQRAPHSRFWSAARELDPSVERETHFAAARAGHLAELFEAAGLRDVDETELSASFEYTSFEDWWEPFTLGVGPAGAHVRALDESQRAELRERCRALLPDPPFTLQAAAWAARGIV